MTASKACNISLKSCTDSRSFGCQLDTQACRKVQTSLDDCLAGWGKKNVSYTTLETACNELNSDWENTTKTLDVCEGLLRTSDETVAELQESLRASHQATADLKAGHEKELQKCKDRISVCQGVVDSVHTDLRCMQDHPNCTYESGKYLCLPRFYTASLCLIVPQTGQEFFHLGQCNLLGDASIYHLALTNFVAGNPWVATTLILLCFFATLGFLATFVAALWVVSRYRRRSQFYGLDDAHVEVRPNNFDFCT